MSLEEVEPQRMGMAITRSSGIPMTDFETLFQAIPAHATRAAEKLRRHRLVAGTLTVFFQTNRHRQDRPQYSGSRSTRLMPMSSDTFDFVAAARRCLLDVEQARGINTTVRKWQGPIIVSREQNGCYCAVSRFCEIWDEQGTPGMQTA